MTLVRKLALSLALMTLGALAVASIASATPTAPAPTGFFEGNINSCGIGDKSVEAVLDLAGPWAGGSSGSWPVTQVSEGGLVVDITDVTTVGGQLQFNWSSNLAVDLAVVKQGNGGAYWAFDPAQTGGTLAAYNDREPSGGISHVLFCYQPKLTVTKTAVTSKTTTYGWTVDKTADPTSHQMTNGDDAQTSNYTLDVRKSAGVDSGWKVSGVITVKNNSGTNLLAVTVTDTLEGATGLIIDPSCTGAFALAAGATKNCSYSANLPNDTTRLNTAYADSGSNNVADGSGTAQVDFANATVTKINDTATLTDTYGSQSWSISSSSDDKQYTREFSCGESQIYPNTARILGDNPATPGIETTYVLSQDSASVTVVCDEAPVPLLVEKSAAGSFTRTHTWTVTKTVDKSSITLDAGASGSVQWTIGLTEAVVDSNFKVNGTIKVSNANAFAIENVDVTDSMSGATIDCDGADGAQSTDLTIPAAVDAVKGFVLCSYSVGVVDAEAGDEGVNTATASVPDGNEGVAEISSEPATWSFNEPTEIDAFVDVVDSNGKVFADVSDPAAVPFPTSYTQSFTCGADAGKHTNTVVVLRDGTDFVLDTASADTTVICNGTTPPPVPPTLVPPVVTPPVVTPPVVTPQAPLLPPTAKPKPKPKPKPNVKSAVCTVITINKKSIAVEKKSTVTVRLTAGGKAVAGAKVRFKGPGINKVVTTNTSGRAIVSLNPRQSGIITVSVVGKKGCSTQRLGVVGTFEPPVTG